MLDLFRMPVADVMTYRPVVIGPDQPLSEAALLFEAHRINTLPVCNEGWLVGVLTRMDLVRACATALDQGQPHAVALGDVLSRPASEIMSTSFVTVEPQAPVARAVDHLVRGGYHSVPVVFGALLIGIVTRGDVMRAMREVATQAPSCTTRTAIDLR